ncbi:MAG: LysR family transcriptional regulator [Peptococcaceae bacterium]|nr:LysR family transcriptional regulator [Peptococcaceae bacterium]
MNFDQLRQLILVQYFGSINKASEYAHMSQQALNKSMKKLEAELNIPLFDYTPKGVSLTSKGVIFSNACEEALSIMDNTIEQLQASATDASAKSQKIECLDILFSPAIGQTFISNVTKIFAQTHPQVQLTLIEGETDEISDMILKEKQSGIGIIASYKAPENVGKGFKRIPIIDDKLYAIVPKRHVLARQKSVSIRTILKYPIAIYQTNYNIANPMCSLLEEYGNPHYRIKTNNIQMYRNAVTLQNCIAFINKAAIKRHAVFQDTLDSIVFLPVTNIPNILILAITSDSYYEAHKNIIKDFLSTYHFLY